MRDEIRPLDVHVGRRIDIPQLRESFHNQVHSRNAIEDSEWSDSRKFPGQRQLRVFSLDNRKRRFPQHAAAVLLERSSIENVKPDGLPPAQSSPGCNRLEDPESDCDAKQKKRCSPP